MGLNKTQINYFKERVRIIAPRVKAVVEKCYPVPEIMSRAEKLEMIAAGTAQLKYDYLVVKLGGQWGSTNVYDAFEFPGECQRERDASTAKEELAALLKQIDAYAEKLCDDFVLGRIDDPTATLADFEASGPRFIDGDMPQ